MAVAEDATSVLDMFINDAANLPAEMAHIMEEIRAKDVDVQEARKLILQHDASLQKHVKLNGVQQAHPKEEQLNKTVKSNYEKAVSLQGQKIALCDKAASLLDRHVKRLDLKIRDLVNEGAMQEDLALPSVLRDSPGNLVDPNSNTGTGTNTPKASFPFAAGGMPNIANAAVARMTNSGLVNGRGLPSAGAAGMQPHALLNGGPGGGHGPGHAQARRESSAGASGNDAKRRRLHLGTLPDRPSNLARQTSLGPGTPKAGTPVSRAGSAGPRTKKMAKGTKQEESMRKKVGKSGVAQTAKGKPQRKVGKASPSTTGDDDDSDASGSEAAAGRGPPGAGAAGGTTGNDGAADEDVDGTGYEDDDEEVDDNKIYCVCNGVSHGDMVACDNQRCEMEWFHWECVGLTQEPKGKWLCPNCEKLPKSQIKYSRGGNA